MKRGFILTTKQSVLEKLQNNIEYISGQDLANELNISRASIWKAINSLKKDGYLIDSINNKGYKLLSEKDVLLAKEIKNCIPNFKDFITIYNYSSVTSTNTMLKNLFEKGTPEFSLVVADTQTEGRGRLGRTFYSPEKTGIYFSILLKPNFTISESTKLSALTATAVCDAIKKLTELNPEIKWINDIYLNNQKVCGILTEASSNFESGELNYVIIGIGINISTTYFPDNISDSVGSLNCSISRSQLIGEIVNNIITIYKSFNDTSHINKYRQYLNIINKSISFKHNNKLYTGKAVSINDDGRLLVNLNDNSNILLSHGEIKIINNSNSD